MYLKLKVLSKRSDKMGRPALDSYSKKFPVKYSLDKEVIEYIEEVSKETGETTSIVLNRLIFSMIAGRESILKRRIQQKELELEAAKTEYRNHLILTKKKTVEELKENFLND